MLALAFAASAFAWSSSPRSAPDQAASLPVASARIELAMPGYVRDLKLADGRIACLLWQGELIVLDRESGKPVARIDAEGPPATAVAISPDGRWIATGGVREMVPSAPDGFLVSDFDGPIDQILGGFAPLSEVRHRDQHYDGPHRAPFANGVGNASRVPRGGSVTIREVGHEGTTARRADFPRPISALEFAKTRLIAVEEGASVTVLDPPGPWTSRATARVASPARSPGRLNKRPSSAA